MSDRKAVNKWYPPDWDPSKGSLNTYHGESWRNGSATVNGRAGASKGVQIIRFETPWNFWCTGCDNMVGRGVRYNAIKDKAGKYYTTPIWRFTMKCHLCSEEIVIETDPKNDDYRIVSGGKRKSETWKASSTETIELADSVDKERLASDPMYRLEHGEADKRKAKTAAGAIAALIKRQTRSDYDDNAKLRKSFRTKRKAIASDKKVSQALLAKSSLEDSAVTIVPEHPADRAAARRAPFASATHRTTVDALERRKRAAARESIFDGVQASHSKRHSAAGKAVARGLNPAKFRLLTVGATSDATSGLATRTTGSRAVTARALVRRKGHDQDHEHGHTTASATSGHTSLDAADHGAGLVDAYDSD
eukprot:m.10744 g.10744  ORF g.10744 m.10744 type:complete len:363 (-) comp2774_c0_seq2:833-1921(-)